MANITDGNTGTRRDYVTGNMRIVQVTSNLSGSTDVWKPGLRIIEAVDVMLPGTASTVTTGSDLSTAGQVTITSSGAATAAVLRAFGF